MRNSKIRNSAIAAGLMLAFAAVPFSQVMAQDAGSMQKSSENETVPDKAADAWITTKVKSTLLAEDATPGMDIEVETKDGVVSLSGTVATEAEKEAAIAKAKGIKGVRDVAADGLKTAE